MRLLQFTLLSVLYIPALISAINLKGNTFSVLQSLVKSKQSKSNKKTTIPKGSLKSSSTKKEKGKQKLATIDEADDDNSVNSSEEVTKAFTSPLAKLLPFTTPLFLALSFLITWKVNFADKRILFIARATFAIYMIVAQLIVFHIEKKINKLNDLTPVIDKRAVNPFQAFKQVAAPSAVESTDSDKTTSNEETTSSESSITTKDYDLQQLKSYSTNLLMEGAMNAYMHFQQKSVKSLVFSQLMGLANLLNNNVIKIHLLGMKPVGSLKRPFTSGMEQMVADAMKKIQEKAATNAATGQTTESTATTTLEEDEKSESVDVNTDDAVSEESPQDEDNYSDSLDISDDSSTTISVSASTLPSSPKLDANSETDDDSEGAEDDEEEETEQDNNDTGDSSLDVSVLTSTSSTTTSSSTAESIQNAMNDAIDDLTQLKKE